jgi:thiamine kinase-like enzyme
MSLLTLPEPALISHIAGLPIWKGKVRIDGLFGGLCNRSFVARDDTGKYVVRVGDDIWVHGIVQASVQNAMRIATELGVTAHVRYTETGLTVSDFIEGRCLRPDDIHDRVTLAKLVECVRRLHEGSHAVRGPLIYFWPFQVVRHYAQFCREHGSRLSPELDALTDCATRLEGLVPPFKAVFTHNDLAPQNAMIDTAGRVFVVDWDYGAYGHPMFDIAAITGNADGDESLEQFLLECYFGRPDEGTWKLFHVFKLILNLREYLWGAVQEIASPLDAATVSTGMAQVYPGHENAYSGYTDMNRRRYYDTLAFFEHRYG